MPRISAFCGIVVTMYYNDHPPAHFHVRYAEYRAQILIATLDVLDGSLPARPLKLVQEWGARHRFELAANWRRAVEQLPLDIIEPLR
jgi:Domain of unknown function (DUF4160)